MTMILPAATAAARAEDVARAAVIDAAVSGDALSIEAIAARAKIPFAEVTALLTRGRLTAEEGNAILAGLTNPNARLDSVVVYEPANTVAPAVTSDDTAGTLAAPEATDTLTTTDGTWIGDATLTETYVWYRSTDPAGLNATVIAGETTNAYTVVVGDIGDFLFCQVTSTNSSGASVVNSNVSGRVVVT